MKRIFYSTLAFVALILSCNYIYSHYSLWKKQIQPINISGTLLAKTKNVAPFTLNNNSSKFTDQNLINKWSVLYFGYSRCPDICPTMMSTLNQTYKKLLAFDLNKKLIPQVVFISIDSDFDNSNFSNINQYAKNFNKKFIGVTGSKTQLDILAKNLGVAYKKIDINPDNYQFDHSSTLFIINPKGQLQAIFSGPFEATDLAKDFKSIFSKYS